MIDILDVPGALAGQFLLNVQLGDAATPPATGNAVLLVRLVPEPTGGALAATLALAGGRWFRR
jgi:hypothetical protein